MRAAGRPVCCRYILVICQNFNANSNDTLATRIKNHQTLYSNKAEDIIMDGELAADGMHTWSEKMSTYVPAQRVGRHFCSSASAWFCSEGGGMFWRASITCTGARLPRRQQVTMQEAGGQSEAVRCHSGPRLPGSQIQFDDGG